MNYSVAIPAYNASATIADTLRSVMAQTVAPTEIIVVDDGSDDGTAQIAASISDKVQVIRNENAGCGAATTCAVRATRYPIVATLDADDLWVPTKIEKQLRALGSESDKRMVFARHRQFVHGSDDFESGPIRPGLTRSDLVFYRAVFECVGDIVDPPGGRGEMVDWLARTREAGFIHHVVDEVLVYRRLIAGSLSYGRDAERDRGYLSVAYEAMKRRKLREGSDN